jgi:hypothetical protein
MARVMPTSQTPTAPTRQRVNFPIPKFSIKRFIRLAVLILIVWLLVQVARTGMWNIPIISKFAYHEPQPIHAVIPANENFQDLTSRMVALVGQREADLKENELTMLVNQGAANLHLGITEVAVAADNSQNNLEMSFRIPQKRNALVRLRLKPKVSSDGNLIFQSQKTQIGEIVMPNWIIGEPVRLLLAVELQPILKPLPKLQGVEVQSSGLHLIW